jgi:hypothetical protein
MMNIPLDRADMARISKALKLQFAYLLSQEHCDEEIRALLERFDHLRQLDASKN